MGRVWQKVKPKNPKSKVWNYFNDALDGEHVLCIVCAEIGKETKYKIKDGETTSLRNHVQNIHGPEWADLKSQEKIRDADKLKENKAKRRRNEDPQQPSVQKMFHKLTLVDPQGAAQNKYDRLLLELLGCNFLPFSIVDSPEFHTFVRNLDKTINLKTASTYSRQMHTYCQQLLDDVRKLISEHCDCSMAITTDLWTSRTQDSYISVTTHFIDKEFRLHRWTPACSLFE